MSLAGGLLIAAAPLAVFLLLLGTLRQSKRIPPRIQWGLTMSLIFGATAAATGGTAYRAWAAITARDWFAAPQVLSGAAAALLCGFIFFTRLRAGPPAPLGAETLA